MTAAVSGSLVVGSVIIHVVGGVARIGPGIVRTARSGSAWEIHDDDWQYKID